MLRIANAIITAKTPLLYQLNRRRDLYVTFPYATKHTGHVMSGRPSKNFRWQEACMYLFLQLQSEGHGGGWLDVQMKHSGGSSVGKVASCCARSPRGSTSSCAGTTRTVISAAGAVLVSSAGSDGPSSIPHFFVPAPKLAPTEIQISEK